MAAVATRCPAFASFASPLSDTPSVPEKQALLGPLQLVFTNSKYNREMLTYNYLKRMQFASDIMKSVASQELIKHCALFQSSVPIKLLSVTYSFVAINV